MITLPTAPDRAYRRADFDTLTEALDYAAAAPTGIGLHDLRGAPVTALTYGRLRELAVEAARRLMAAGLDFGERVALVAETDARFVVGFFACHYAGLVPVPLPPPSALGSSDAFAGQLRRFLTASRAAAVFGPDALSPLLREVAAGGNLKAAGSLEDLPPPGAADLRYPGPRDTCFIQFSSGSTREPAGVVCSHRSVMANTGAISGPCLDMTPSDRMVSWLPLYHDLGLVGFLLTPLVNQMSTDLAPPGAFVRRPMMWLEMISRYRATISYSPTFGYELCGRRGLAPEGLDLSSWRVAGCGGDMVRPSALRAFAARYGACGFDPRAFVASYGMAEATVALALAPPGRGLETADVDLDRMERDGTVATPDVRARRREFACHGRILPDHQLQVRDASGQSLPERTVGRFFVRGPSVTAGYFEAPGATAAVIGPDGWLDTGDVGFMMDGEIVPTGRAKDLMLLNGRNIWPQDLEWTAESETPGLRSGDVAAFAVDDGVQESLVVLIQCRTAEPEARRTLTQSVGALLRVRHAVHARVELVGPHALPRTSSGKLRRTQARQQYLAGALGPGVADAAIAPASAVEDAACDGAASPHLDQPAGVAISSQV